MPSQKRLLIEAPRWLFLLALVLAPWVYGCTPDWAVDDLDMLLCVILALWFSSYAIRGIKRSIHRTLLFCVAIILAYGWAMALNPHFQAVEGYRFNPIHAPLPMLPGTVDKQTSCEMMLRISCLLGVVCFVCDLSTRREWRRRIWCTMAATGSSLVLFGLVQSAFEKPIFLWSGIDDTVPYFATYYYHGNAGSFINLVMPFVAGLAALTLRKPDQHFERALWFPGFFVCVAGAFVNLSRSAMVITCLLVAMLLIWQSRGRSRNELLPPRGTRAGYAILMVCAITCLVAFSGWQRPLEKWRTMEGQLNSSNKRLVSTKVCLRMLPDAGWHGFGPGTFELVFPHYTSEQEGKLIPGIWRYAHDDYLQTILEWGWVGAIPWAILFFGTFAEIYRNWKRRRDLSTSDRVLAFVTGTALLGAAAHAIVDFPFQIASLQLYAGVCAGFAWSSAHWEGTMVHHSKPRTQSALPASP